MNNKELENKILNEIRKHIGKDNPIQVEDLMKVIPLSDREIRKIVQFLVNECNNPIGSTTKGPYGFYMIADLDDYLEAIKNLSNRKKRLAERVEKLRKSCIDNGIKVPKVDVRKEGESITFNISNSIVIYLK